MTRMMASEAFVETLAAHGVRHVFGIVGSAYLDPLDIFEEAGIRFISTNHEQGAGHMADGYARAGNIHGVCIVQNGPGVTNLVTAVAAANWAHSPVVCITPQAATHVIGQGSVQEVEQLPFFEKITKYQCHVNRADRIAEFTNRCFNLALSRRGPTQLNIPRDYFYDEIDVEIPGPIAIRHSSGNAVDLDAAVECLLGAKYPVVLVGGGLIISEGQREVEALVEFLGAPVVASYLHNDAIRASHTLMCGPLGFQGSKAAMNVIAKADVVLALGSRIGPFTTLPEHGLDYWPKSAKVIQVDIHDEALGLARPVDVPILGDARGVARELLARCKERGLTAEFENDRCERLSDVSAEKDRWDAELSQWGNLSGMPIPPKRALYEFAKVLPGDAMVSTDVGNISSVSNGYLKFESPKSFFGATCFRNCGYAFPTAIGAKVANPDRPAIAIVGDGAWGMSMGETLTCVREDIPVVSVVFNNHQWGSEKSNQIDYYANRCVGTNLENPSFSSVAKAMGANGYLVEHEDQLGDALRAAVDSGRPAVVEVMITQELTHPARRDVLKKGKKLLPKYENYSYA